MRVPLTKPCLDPRDLEVLRQPLESGWVAQGPQVRAFEQAVAARVHAAHAVACSSGTTGLHLALVSLGIGPGDEVIVPSFTWVATANAVLQTGATPVLCDIELDSFNIDVAGARALITDRSRAIVPVHQFGRCADMDAVLSLARNRDLAVVEDAACALGSRNGDQHAGTMGDCGVFSFHPRKILTTGEGGMVLTADAPRADLLRSLRNHGACPDPALPPDHPATMGQFEQVGFNYRMTDLQAALGVRQMTKLDWMLARRAELARQYDARLAALDWLRRPAIPQQGVHAFQSYVLLYCPESPVLGRLDALCQRRNALMARLQHAGVATRPGTHAVHCLTFFRQRHGLAPEQMPQALFADRLSIALPLYPQMTEAELDHVVCQLQALGP